MPRKKSATILDGSTSARDAGRPPAFTDEVADLICAQIAEGKSLREICRDPSMPGRRTVFDWLESKQYPDFRTKYARARTRAAEAFEDEIIEAARSATAVDAAAKRLHVDTLRWVMSKRAPKVYGDKITQEHTGADGGPIEIKGGGISALLAAANGSHESRSD